MEIYLNFGRQFPLVDKQRGFVLLYEQVADKDRVAVYVRSAQVECPCYLVKCGDEHAVCMSVAYSFPDTGQLRLYAFSCILLRLYLHHGKRNLRTVFPYL